MQTGLKNNVVWCQRMTLIFLKATEPLLAHLSRIPMLRRRRCRCRRPPFSNVFSSETARPIKAKFFVEPPWEGGTKVCINGPGHMTKMAAMPIYGKNLKKSSSPEPGADFHETWYVASGTPAHHSLYK